MNFQDGNDEPPMSLLSNHDNEQQSKTLREIHIELSRLQDAYLQQLLKITKTELLHV